MYYLCFMFNQNTTPMDTLTMMNEIKRLNRLCQDRGVRMNELSRLLHASVCALRFYQSVLGEKIDTERYKKYQSIIDQFNEIY